MLFFIFWPLLEKLLDCPKKIIVPDSGRRAAAASSYAYEYRPILRNACDCDIT